MTVLLAWVVFPLLLTVLALGCGLAAAAASGRRLPGPLMVAIGFAAIIVVAQLLTLGESTAPLSAPIVVALAVIGFGLSGAARLRRGEWGAAATAVAVFAAYAAPIVLSGEATFAGYIRLDDTATWMALTDRVMEHGRDLTGLAPSSYEATLAFNLADGYPIGVFLPLDVGRELLGTDVAWLVQPYMAWLAALLALALWSCARPVISSTCLRGVAVFVAAQPALLFGYYLWGGIKELASAALIAALAAGVGHLAAERFATGAVVAVGCLCAALVGVLSIGGAVWLAPVLVLALALAGRELAWRVVARRSAVLAAATAVLTVPVLASGALLPPTSSPLTDSTAQGNLIGALEPSQIAGVWPAGDFRIDVVASGPAYLLIAVTTCAAAAGLVVIWRRRSWGALAYVGGSIVAAAMIYAIGSPWVDGKALATASPAIPFAAAVAAAALLASGRRIQGLVLLAAVAGGVLWSNALAYRDLNLAPRDRLVELERIGELIEGEGPALMTEYEPYGVRHFLRGADPEGISELRRREIPLRGGKLVGKGGAADTDAIDAQALGIYRTLVLRRSPTQSRPPGAYELIWQGDSYEAWQRPAGSSTDLGPRIALGARGRQPVIVPLSRARYPNAWATSGDRASPRPEGAGTLAVAVEVARAGLYQLWLEGSLRPAVKTFVDGSVVGSVRHRLNNRGQYVSLGSARLESGEHQVEIRVGDADLAPGSGGVAGAIGPLVLSGGEAADTQLVHVGAATHQRLCGREWDWIELQRAGG